MKKLIKNYSDFPRKGIEFKDLLGILREPIVFKKPFIIYGGKGIHSKLEELGFKLHIELFDYSFDNEDNRLDLICEQVNKYIDMHPNKLRDIIDFDLVDYNYEKSMDIWR